MKNHILLVLLLGFYHVALAQGVTAAADKQKILIGEQFHFQLVGRFDKGQALKWFTVDSLPHFEILHSEKIDTILNGDQTTLSQVFTLTSWDSGVWQLPPFSLGRTKTPPIKIDVAFSPSPFDVTQPYHDVKEIIEVKKPVEAKWYWYVIFAAIIAILFLLFFPKEKKKPKAGFIPDEGAYKNALNKLDQLKEREPEHPKVLHTQLVHIFREYLHKRKNIYSFSKTTDDLVVQMEKLSLPSEQRHTLLQTLRLSDAVKFARLRPNREENTQAIEKIKESITNIENTPNVV